MYPIGNINNVENTVNGKKYNAEYAIFREYYILDGYCTYDAFVYKVSLTKFWVVWWPYNDYFYSRLSAVVAGGNSSSTDNSSSHWLRDDHYPNATFETDQLQDNIHSYYFYVAQPNVADYLYLMPEISEISFSWYTIKIPGVKWSNY